MYSEYTDDYMCGLEVDEKVTFYKHLTELGCNCEMVWIDINKHDSFYGMPITLLGVDIENEHVESVVLEGTPRIEDALKVLELEKSR